MVANFRLKRFWAALIPGVGLLAALVWSLAFARGSSSDKVDRAVYRLDHVQAAEVHRALVDLLPQAEVRVDEAANRVIVRGDARAHQLAQNTIKSLDRPAAPPATPPATSTGSDAPVLKAYPCPAGDAARQAARLQSQLPAGSNVRISPDERSGQILVVAPPDVQSWVAQSLRAAAVEPPQAAAPVGPARPEAMESHTVQLQNRESRQVEAAMLQMLAGRLTPLPGGDGQQASYRLAVSEGSSVELLFERPTNRVTVRGVGRLMDSCIRLVRALDGAGQTGEAGMQLVSVKATPAAALDRTIAAVTADVPAAQPPAAQPPAAQPPAAPPPAAPVAPPGPPTATQPQAAAPESNLVGPVRIEMLEGLDVMVIRGNKRDVDRVVAIINEIEQLSAETEPAVEIHQLKHVDCTQLATLVTQLYSQVFSPRQGAVSITALVKPNALLLVGRPESVRTVVDLVARLDQPVAAGDPVPGVSVASRLGRDGPDADRGVLRGPRGAGSEAPGDGRLSLEFAHRSGRSARRCRGGRTDRTDRHAHQRGDQRAAGLHPGELAGRRTWRRSCRTPSPPRRRRASAPGRPVAAPPVPAGAPRRESALGRRRNRRSQVDHAAVSDGRPGGQAASELGHLDRRADHGRRPGEYPVGFRAGGQHGLDRGLDPPTRQAALGRGPGQGLHDHQRRRQRHGRHAGNAVRPAAAARRRRNRPCRRRPSRARARWCPCGSPSTSAPTASSRRARRAASAWSRPSCCGSTKATCAIARAWSIGSRTPSPSDVATAINEFLRSERQVADADAGALQRLRADRARGDRRGRAGQQQPDRQRHAAVLRRDREADREARRTAADGDDPGADRRGDAEQPRRVRHRTGAAGFACCSTAACCRISPARRRPRSNQRPAASSPSPNRSSRAPTTRPATTSTTSRWATAAATSRWPPPARSARRDCRASASGGSTANWATAAWSSPPPAKA